MQRGARWRKETFRTFCAVVRSDTPKCRNSELMRLANSLEIGESLFIPKAEWAATGFKSEPTSLVHSSSYHPRALIFRKRFSTRKRRIGKLHVGWLITREH